MTEMNSDDDEPAESESQFPKESTAGLRPVLLACLHQPRLYSNPQALGRSHWLQYTYMMHSASISSSSEDVTEVTEGLANVLFPKSVFYNPVQEFNRDLTIAVIRTNWNQLVNHVNSDNSSETKAFDTDCKNQSMAAVPLMKCDNGLRILEGLAASGLRSMRFALEIPMVKQIVANDFDSKAVSFIQENIKKNKVEDLVTASCNDASMLMYKNRALQDRFDVIDLDPYGGAEKFLDGAVQSVKDGGLLCVTCTDTALLCGNTPETCFAKYGAMAVRIKACHEMALRIVLQSIESHANRYSRYIVPLLSVSVDFYIRLFVRVYTSQSKVKESVTKRGFLYHCSGCGTFTVQTVGRVIPTNGGNFKYTPATGPVVGTHCSHCGWSHNIGGPIWTDRIHQPEFVETLLKHIEESSFGTQTRLEGMLKVIHEELPDCPLYYITDALCSVVHCTPPTLLQFRSAILNAGYNVSLSHAAKNSHKTDAPASLIWDIIRCWVKQNPVKSDRLKDGTVAKVLLSRAPESDVNFDLHPKANPDSRQQGLVRYQINPKRNWGPKPRAKMADVGGSGELDKRLKNQGKRKKDKLGKPCKHDLTESGCKHQKTDECTCTCEETGQSCQNNKSTEEVICTVSST